MTLSNAPGHEWWHEGCLCCGICRSPVDVLSTPLRCDDHALLGRLRSLDAFPAYPTVDGLLDLAGRHSIRLLKGWLSELQIVFASNLRRSQYAHYQWFCC